MSKRVYLVTLHTGNSLTVHSHRFVRGRTVVVEDEALVNYLKGHPNFTIVAKRVDDDAVASDVLPESKENEGEGGTNTTADVDNAGMTAKAATTNVAKAPVRRSKSAS